MKLLILISIILLCTQCSSQKESTIENDVYIARVNKTLDANLNLTLKDTATAIRFSKDFWNYFIRTHPKSSAMIFVEPIYDTSNNYVALNDTSLQFFNLARLNSFYFTKLLADSVEGKEKEGMFPGATFFIIPNDTTDFDVKEKRIEQRLKEYKITPTVREDFKKLKSILTWQDSTQYIIVFKKSFVNSINKLYE